MKGSKVLTGVAGEYFVSAELSRRGYIASITLRNTRGIDVIASDKDGKKSVTLQIKTSQGSSPNFLLNKHAEEFFAENHYYCFVNLLKENLRPEFFIVPSKDVADFVKSSHAEWLKTPGRKGQQHNDTSMRIFTINDKKKYLDRWDLLNL